MKKWIALLISFTCFTLLRAQQSPAISLNPDSTKKIMVVEASCGLCQFGMKAHDCALAVRFNGKNYFVEGASIDDFGDAHAKNGFCNAIRKAEVQGTIVNNRFKATFFRLLSPTTH